MKMSLPHSIHVVSHPLVQHKLTKMRDKETSSTNFRRLLREMGLLLGYDATRDLPLVERDIATPIESMKAPLLEGKKLVVVPILRAGLGLVMSGSIVIRARCRRSSTISGSRRTSPTATSSSAIPCWRPRIRPSRLWIV
jgi:uracil phosphoribosyltransferase